MTRRLLLVASLAALLVGVGAANVWSTGAAAMRESDAMMARGRWREAAVAAKTAAEAVVPGSPYPGEGYARLEALARAAEVEGRVDDAGFDWRAIRAATRATRFPGSTSERVAAADLGILRAARAGAGSAPEATLRAELAESP